MKKLIALLIFVFILTDLMYGQTCDRYFSTTITYNNDLLDLHYDNASFGNHFKIFHRTNESVNTNSSVIDIKKPIIVIEGYDIFFQESCDDIYDNYINYAGLGNNLRAKGYDIITFNLSYPMAALQPNALIFTNFIDFINENKTGNEELIVMGVSMGGLITRYALSYMEKYNRQHQTKLFLSFDSPQKGGYAPLSMQALLSDPNIKTAAFASAMADSPELAYLINCFLSDGTLQMLTHHALEIENGKAYPTQHHINFFEEINSLNSCGGYPINCKNVGISNGSLNAENQTGNGTLGSWNFSNYSGNPAVGFHIDQSWVPYIARDLYTVPGIDNWALREGRCIYLGCWRDCEECNLDHNYYMEKNGLPLDHAPGGYYPWFGKLVEELNKINSITVDYYNNENTCFVPTISALGLNTNDLLLNVADYSKDQILNHTHFDDIWWDTTHTNMRHTSYNSSLYNFIATQIGLSESENYAQANNSIYSGSTNSGDKKIYKASNAVSIENHTVKNGGQLTLKSGNTITLKPGFAVEVGATFSASIEDIQTRDCNLADNLPQFTHSSLKSSKTQSDSYKIDTIIRGYNVALHAPIDINSNFSSNEPTSAMKIEQKGKTLKVFPNPTSDFINIIFNCPENQEIIVKLIEPVTGKIIKTIFSGKKSSGIYNENIDISALSIGAYVVLIQTENKKISEKFIKK